MPTKSMLPVVLEGSGETKIFGFLLMRPPMRKAVSFPKRWRSDGTRSTLYGRSNFPNFLKDLFSSVMTGSCNAMQKKNICYSFFWVNSPKTYCEGLDGFDVLDKICSTTITPFVSQNTVAVTFPADRKVMNFFVLGEFM
ncbi:hypothetical protein Trydic_g20478 [Trypoxylus dichotomus]